ncbi:hypothetical protein B0H34DRAFT_799643 [Crassisporium funariophilum]|nr:hypothetical protein B0H34DRAFT_799643 [Crassisporium funariophilum]
MTTYFHNVAIAGGSLTFVNSEGRNEEGCRALHEHIVPSAFHDSGDVLDQPKCHPDTRVAVLDTILAWVENSERKYPAMWLHGPAGTGKTAIMRSISERCEALKLLLATFFFSRFADGRNNAKRLIATVAYQVALNIPSTRPYIEQAAGKDPAIFNRSFEAQIRDLLVGPLELSGAFSTTQKSTPIPCLIVIDGLDECHDPDSQICVLYHLYGLIRRHRLPLAILIASRPEKHLRAYFDIGESIAHTTRLLLNDFFQPDADIRLFLSSKFSEIKNRHPFRYEIPAPWPLQHDIELLVAKASGHFIFASIVVKYVGAINHRPVERLSIILGLKADNSKPFAELDALYHHILCSVSNISLVLRILGSITYKSEHRNSALVNPDHDEIYTSPSGPPRLDPYTIDQFFSLNQGDTRHALADLDFILVEILHHDRDIRFLHASLQDFLMDRSRSGQYHIDLATSHADSAVCYFNYLRHNDLPKSYNEILSAIRDHLRHALPTDELHYAITHCDIISPSLTQDVAGVLLGWPYLKSFLRCVENSKLGDAQLVSRKLASSVDAYFKLELRHYHSDQSLHDLLVLAACGATSYQPLILLWKELDIALSDKDLHPIDNNALRIFRCCTNVMPHHAPPIITSNNNQRIYFPDLTPLSDYLRSRERSGRYHITGKDISAMALRALQGAVSGFEE